MALYRLIHLDFDDNKIFEIKDMTNRMVYVTNCDLLGSGSRKRWEPANEYDRVNVRRRWGKEEDNFE